MYFLNYFSITLVLKHHHVSLTVSKFMVALFCDVLKLITVLHQIFSIIGLWIIEKFSSWNIWNSKHSCFQWILLFMLIRNKTVSWIFHYLNQIQKIYMLPLHLYICIYFMHYIFQCSRTFRNIFISKIFKACRLLYSSPVSSRSSLYIWKISQSQYYFF